MKNLPEKSIVASLSTVDEDSNDVYSYSLIEGDGDSDNFLFTIEGNKLK